jgi:proton-dependent oligopeptide transporter, POT family
MLVALATYLSGYRYLPARVKRKARITTAMTSNDRKVVAALFAAMAITILPQIAYYQLANVLPVWLEQHGNMNAGGFAIPIPWYQSIDPLFSIITLPLLFALWRWQGRLTGRDPWELRKIGTGSLICGGANLILVGAIALSPGKVLWLWPFLYCAVQGVGFMYFWPPLLSLVSRAAPARINSTMMGMAFIVLFVANNLIGWIGTFYERMTPIAFWTLHFAVGATGWVLVLIFGRALGRILEPQAQPER